MLSKHSEFTGKFPGACVTHSFGQDSVNIFLNKFLHMYIGKSIVSVGVDLDKGKKVSSQFSALCSLSLGNSSQDSSGSTVPVFCLTLCLSQVVFL